MDSSSPPPPPLPRRWSDATGTPRGKKIAEEQQQQKFMSPVVSLPCLTLKQSLDHLDELRIPSMNASPRRRSGRVSSSGQQQQQQPANSEEEDYVRIPKREYEAIKNRVTAIEKRISREFEFVQATKSSDLSDSNSHGNNGTISGPSFNVNQSEEEDVSMMTSPPSGQIANVQDKYVRALEETEELNRSTGGTDELAKRLGRDLKIRRSVEHKIMRSPSARKIGSIRRRSSNTNSKLNRTKSLNITKTTTTTTMISGREKEEKEERVRREVMEDNEPVGLFYPRQTSNLKRGRPNTIQSGLRVHRSPPDGGRRPERADEATMRRRSATMATLQKPIPLISGPNEFYPAAPVAVLEEVWTDAQDFFAEKQPPLNVVTVTPKRIEASERRGSLRSAGKTPNGPTGSSSRFAMPNPEDNLLKTPMLPPKRAPRKTPGSSMAKNHYLTPLQQAQQTGRASIARIRSQNAGMVLAKARLFNDLVTDDEKAPPPPSAVALEVKRAMGMALQKENRETPKTFVTSFRKPQIKPVLLANSPRRLVKTPSRERATPVRALPRSPPRPQANRSAAVRQF